MNKTWRMGCLVAGLIVLLVCVGVVNAKTENLIEGLDNESKSFVIEYNISDEFLGLGYISDSPFLHLNNLSEYKPITSPKVDKIYADTKMFPNITDTVRYDATKQQIKIVDDSKVESNTNLTKVPPYYGLFQIYESSSENASEDITTKTVFPPDDRKRILDTTKYPWCTICQLLIDWPNGDKNSCSGAIIDNFHVLTAGHCVYDKSEGGWAKSIKVIPGLNKDKNKENYMPFGYAWVTYMRTYKGWTWFQMREHDWAVLTLDRNIGKYTGWMGRMFRDSSDPIYRGILNIAGYPGDKEEGTMWYDADYGRDANEYIHWYYMDTYKGQSGSPVWVKYSSGNRYILTVHTRGDDGTHSNSGTRLNKDKFDRIIEWTKKDKPPKDYADLIDDGEKYSGFSPTTILQGEAVTIWCRIRNIGTAASGGFYVSFYASKNKYISTSDYFLGKVNVPSISPFHVRAISVKISIPFNIPAGEYYVGWIIDSSNNVKEFNENNNIGLKTDYKLKIKEVKPQPKITYIDYPRRIGAGEWATVHVKAKNYGGKASWQTITVSFPDLKDYRNIQKISSNTDRFYVGKPGDEFFAGYSSYKVKLKYPLVECSKDNVDKNGEIYMKFKVKLEKAGTFRLYIKSVAGGWDSNYKAVAWDPTSGIKDQQNEYVYVYTIDVKKPYFTKRPPFSNPIEVVKDNTAIIKFKVGYGKWFRVICPNNVKVVKVTRNGHTVFSGYKDKVDVSVNPGDRLEVTIKGISVGEGWLNYQLVNSREYLKDYPLSSNSDTLFADSVKIVVVQLNPKIRVIPEDSFKNFDFGKVKIDTSERHEVIIKNEGNAPLKVTSIELICKLNCEEDEFRMSKPLFSKKIPFTVDPGKYEIITITFKPKTEGYKEALLIVRSNDPERPKVEKTIKGTGVDRIKEIKVEPSHWETYVGETKQFTAYACYASGKEKDITHSAEWLSSNPEVVKHIGGGIFKAITVGRATIKARYKGMSDTAQVKVLNRPPTIELLYPPNGATISGNVVTLRWNGDDPDNDLLKYDLYSGTANPPPLFKTNLNSESCKVPLVPGTTYYWKVVAKDNHGGKAESPIWSFTTEEIKYGVDLSCDNSEKSIPSRGYAIYNITVKNTGNVKDIIDLTLPPPCYCGWVYSLDRYSVELLPGESTDVVLNVSDVLGHPVGSYWEVKVIGTSRGDPTKSDFVITKTTIKEENKPPIASFTYSPEIPVVDQTITFDASSSYDPDGTIVKYEWDFGDGSKAEGKVVTHAYSQTGSYIVTLTVTDDDGATDTTSKVVPVVDDWNPWNDPDSDGGEKITTPELQEAIHCWLNDEPAPKTGAEITTERLQEVIHLWLQG